MDTDYNINIGDISSIPPTRTQTVRAKIQEKTNGAKASLLMRVLRSFTLTAGLIYGLLCLMVLFFQDSLIYNPSREINNVPMRYRHSFLNVILETSNDKKIAG